MHLGAFIKRNNQDKKQQKMLIEELNESTTSSFKRLASEVSISEEFVKELKQKKIDQMRDSQLRPKLLNL